MMYRVDEIDGRDVRMRDGIPVTAPARTLIDFAGGEAPAGSRRALAEAHVLRW